MKPLGITDILERLVTTLSLLVVVINGIPVSTNQAEVSLYEILISFHINDKSGN